MSAEVILAQLGQLFTGFCPEGETGWGSGSWGSSPWGGGVAESSSPDLCLAFAFAYRENVVRLYFSDPVKFTRQFDPGDGSPIRNYIVTAESGVGIDDFPVRAIRTAAVELIPNTNNQQIDVTVDRPFSPYGGIYRATVNNLVSTNGKLLGSANSVLFDGLQKGLPIPIPDLAVATRDIANPQTRSALYDPIPEAGSQSDDLLGTLRADSLGDLAYDEGITSYKKRIFRRLTFSKNRTGHIPGYGVGIPNNVKRLARPAVRDALAAEAEEQIRLEPETVAVKVTVEVNPSGVGFYRVRAKTNTGRTVNTAAPIAFSPTEDSTNA